ncbi:amino acid ABC transporter permease [Rhizobium sp. PAMB 3182]
MTFDIDLILASLPAIFKGALVTLSLWIGGTIGAVILGFFVAVVRRYGPKPAAAVLALSVEVLRGTPFLIQIFLLYYGGPYAGIALDPIPAGLFCLCVYGAAYFSEIFRAGFVAVPRGHIEAAECLGFTRGQIIRRILLPEMTMLVLPPSTNMSIILLKETAVLSIITVPEMTLTISALGSQQYAFLEAIFLLAIIYWGLVELAGRLGRAAETRLSRYRFS